MIVKAEELSKAIGKLNAISANDKNKPGILFDIFDNCTMDIYYNTGDKAIKVNIPIETMDADDMLGKVVFDYKRLADILSYCITSGEIKVDTLGVKLKRNEGGIGTCIIHVVKYMEVSGESGETEYQVVSTNDYELAWWGVESLPIKKQVLKQPACEDMFKEEGAIPWSVEELMKLFNGVTHEDAKVMYMSPKYNGVFAVNINSVVWTKSDMEVAAMFALQTDYVKYIISILNSSGIEDIQMNVLHAGKDAVAILFYTDDKSLSIYVKATAFSNSHLQTMLGHSQYGFDTYQLNMVSAVVKDVFKAAANLGASTKGDISFVRTDDGEVCAIVKAVDTGASVSNTYKIVCPSFNTSDDGEPVVGELFRITCDFKLLYDIVNTCKTDYIGLDFTKAGNGIDMRIGFLNFEKAVAAKEVYMNEHGISEMSVTDKMAIRQSYIDTCYFVAIATA